ncbi:SsrA-binding protein [Candidatus Arthromitus sp. SFB-mouse-Japan]|uniref:SsrA-binding protein SmpB n=1 Tax=Candidatus Arthromitus sp. SFB-mouse TaxID=49118 RepID=UPI00021B7CA7|nr:SsrA-binding protein [Candidatus Arthromitus sp. SFB-2]EIA24859.1 SsrA-binding protein [Candidatus Arthromitus sp. SFB-3]EIA28244.1 SsrA-binding protein [Candidatus Arthromitus sp. SFB-co]EIA29615.1 SsrA-binding protein [Candidatus Arthromitus sp. SFB-4]EIA29772.1 SsrA-binding protein [Candidatus Arthromitus sp. SFB-5]EIA31171.1 SsrA-binding protein [Candidatus Arthromitus sp. SFB-mouse-SU]BAK55982.1 SsrA-binding protein [Candidatus Arthromitus sp. SFB-mouse-Japan]BAK79326.1 SsrA-binding 
MSKKSNVISKNRKAFHDYFVEENYEAGIVLVGTEVKSIRSGGVNLKDSYGVFKNGELYIINMHISPYEKGNIFNRDPLRDRKLLLHKKELSELFIKNNQEGYSLIPISLYVKNGVIKVNLGLCKGKKNYDKRDSMLEREHRRDIDRAMKEKYR